MSDLTLYILYLSLWRLIVVLCGALSIYLGYRLFVIGYGQGKSEMQGGFGGVTLAFRNFAPGTAFALFGATLIGVMVALSPAEVTLGPQPRDALAATAPGAAADVVFEPGAGSIILRGD